MSDVGYWIGVLGALLVGFGIYNPKAAPYRFALQTGVTWFLIGFLWLLREVANR